MKNRLPKNNNSQAAREGKSGKVMGSLKTRILIPLTLALIVLLSTFIINTYTQHYKEISSNMERHLDAVDELFDKRLESDKELMTASIEMLSINTGIQKAWLARDRETLLKLTSPILEKLKNKYHIDHFYFHDINRVNFLRVYEPEEYGDRIDRFTLMKAQKLGQVYSGIELGHYESFTLRVVYPWRINNQLVGYIEMGEEIDDIVEKIHGLLNVELYVSIYKEFIDQQDKKEKEKSAGYKERWHYLSSSVIISKTLDGIPESFNDFLAEGKHKYMEMATDLELSLGGYLYRVGVVPLFDTADREIGDIVVLYDVTGQVSNARNSILTVSAICLFVGIILFALFWLILGRVEQQLASSSQKLIKAHDELELKVKERTEDLVAINKELKVKIDERQQAEKKLRESEKKYRNLFENANDCIFIIESETLKFLDANRMAETTYGYSKAEFSQMDLSQITVEQDKKELSYDWWKSIKKYPASFFNQTHVKKDGTTLFADVNASLINYGPKEVILLLMRDLSERNRLENQLIQSSKLASLGELAAGVAHEIGNPLSAISNYTQFLSLAEGMEVEDRESLEGIKVEVSRIDGIIKNLLAFSRSSSEEIAEVDINEVINNAISLISHQRLFRNIKLKKILAADCLQIKADRNQLVQVIVNILLNSAQAMPDGGIIQIQSNCVNGRLKIKLTDTGIGIPKKNLDKIFNPFFTTKPDGVGTGLGLSIVYRIIEKFDGLVEVESPATEKLAKDVTGTTFTITFPVLPREGEI